MQAQGGVLDRTQNRPVAIAAAVSEETVRLFYEMVQCVSIARAVTTEFPIVTLLAAALDQFVAA